jgi:miniconductance mechanosensitive channel
MNLRDSDVLGETLSLLPNSPPWVEALVGVGLLVLAALAANFIVKRIILGLIGKIVPDDWPTPSAIAGRLANVAPALIVSTGIVLVPHLPGWIATVTRNVVGAFVILSVALAVSSALTLVNEIYSRRPDAASRPIKGYVQVVKIGVFFFAAILMVAVLMEQSPLLLLSGLGAMAAVLMLVFKDTILSLVASVQLASNDMLRVGDWIEMPQLNADGDVIDVALHTVKVQNWDKTITTIPTHRLISESFKNWRAMFESGGRRIKRSLTIDLNSIRFLERGEIERLKRFSLLSDYLAGKEAEIAQWNGARPERLHDVVNARRITNIGTFRAYITAYLRARGDMNTDMFLIVRQLEPTDAGLPLEIYGFTADTAWAVHEAVQADIFDHLIAILPEFGLRLFQQPAGRDLAHFGDAGAGRVYRQALHTP